MAVVFGGNSTPFEMSLSPTPIAIMAAPLDRSPRIRTFTLLNRDYEIQQGKLSLHNPANLGGTHSFARRFIPLSGTPLPEADKLQTVSHDSAPAASSGSSTCFRLVLLLTYQPISRVHV